jgi:hypothetical protein
MLAAGCSDSDGAGVSASPSPSLDTVGAEQALQHFIDATLPRDPGDPQGFVSSYSVLRIAPASQAPPPWTISYRVTFLVQPGVASSVSGTSEKTAVFFLARDDASGAWRVWPKSGWVAAYVSADANP